MTSKKRKSVASTKSAGEAAKEGDSENVYFRGFSKNGVEYLLGEAIYLHNPNEEQMPYICKLEKVWKDAKGRCWIQGSWFYRPEDTSGRQSNHGKKEVFESSETDVNRCYTVKGKCKVLPWALKEKHGQDKDTFFCRSRYDPAKKRFNPLPPNKQPDTTIFKKSSLPGEDVARATLDGFPGQAAQLKAERGEPAAGDGQAESGGGMPMSMEVEDGSSRADSKSFFTQAPTDIAASKLLPGFGGAPPLMQTNDDSPGSARARSASGLATFVSPAGGASQRGAFRAHTAPSVPSTPSHPASASSLKVGCEEAVEILASYVRMLPDSAPTTTYQLVHHAIVSALRAVEIASTLDARPSSSVAEMGTDPDLHADAPPSEPSASASHVEPDSHGPTNGCSVGESASEDGDGDRDWQCQDLTGDAPASKRRRAHADADADGDADGAEAPPP